VIYTITLGHVPARIWEKSLAQYHATRHGGVEYRHLFLNQHYPLNKKENEERLREICSTGGVEWLDAGGNLGLHGGFNWVLNKINVQPGDLVIGYDPDSWPISSGWDMALLTAVRDPRVGWASLWGPWVDQDMADRKAKGLLDRIDVGHIETWAIRAPIMNSVCAFRGDFLKASGGLHENYHWYGTLEIAMWSHLQKNNMRWVFLPGWREDHTAHFEQDPEYRRWKWYYVHERKFNGSFADYVAAGCPIL